MNRETEKIRPSIIKARNALLITIIGLFYIKYVYQIIIDERSFFLDILFYAFLLLAFIKRKSNKHALIIIIFILLSFINPAAKNIFLIFSSTYIICQNLDITQLAKINLIFLLCVFAYIYILKELGVIETSMFPQTFLDERERWDFGFRNPNRFAMFIFSIFANLYILLWKKTYWFFFFSTTIIGIWVYNYTQSRTFVMSFLLLLIFSLGIRSQRFSKEILKHKYLYALIPLIICTLIYYLTQTNYYNSLLDILISGRLGLYQNFLNSISPLHYLIGTEQVNDQILDNSYLHLLFEGGIIAFVIFNILLFFTIKNISYNNLYIIPLLISFFAYGMTESIFTFVLSYGNMIIWAVLYLTAFTPQNR